MKTIVKMVLFVLVNFSIGMIIGMIFITNPTFNCTNTNITSSIEEGIIEDTVVELPEDDISEISITTADIEENTDNNTEETYVEDTVEDVTYEVEESTKTTEDTQVSIQVTMGVEEPYVVEPGNHGILTIDGILQCGLDDGAAYGYNGQAHIDNTNQANIWIFLDYEYGGTETWIAQHSNKAFAKLNQVSVGSTAHYDGRDITCVYVDPVGYSDDYTLRLSDGTDVSAVCGNNGVVMYTCAPHNKNYVTIWQ